VPALSRAIGATPANSAAGLNPAALSAAEAEMLSDVRALDTEYKSRLASFAGRAIVTHHAAWKRLADRYGLKVAAVIRPIESSEPTAAAVTAAVHAIEEQHVGAIFVEPQFSPQAAERIVAIAKVKVAGLDPLGDGDWFKMMRANLDSLVKNLAPERK
jgi:zinc transport system substrate-binding protein